MNQEDVTILRDERDATPRRFSNWDPEDSFFKRYHRLSPEEKEKLHQSLPADKEVLPADKEDRPPSSSSSTTSSSTSSVDLEEIRTGHMSRTTTNRINHHETHPDALDRITTHRTQHSSTVGAIKSKKSSRRELPAMGAGKPYPPDLPEMEEYVVEFDGVDDPRHAQNWPTRRKLIIGAILAFDAIAATMGSSIFSAGIPGVLRTFHIGQEVGTLGTSLFVLGYAFGPIMWAPMQVSPHRDQMMDWQG